MSRLVLMLWLAAVDGGVPPVDGGTPAKASQAPDADLELLKDLELLESLDDVRDLDLLLELARDR